MLVAALSLSSLLAGGTLAYAATRAGRRAAAYETWGGVLLLVGLALVGAGLPLFRP